MATKNQDTQPAANPLTTPEKTGDPALDQATGADQLPAKQDTPDPETAGKPTPLPKLKAKKVSERDALLTLCFIVRDNLPGDAPYARDRIDLLLEALGVDEADVQRIQTGITDRTAASLERLAKLDREDRARGVR
jgi:hypothetical protein